jgi:hypothetical protein
MNSRAASKLYAKTVFGGLCEQTHPALLAEKCPWCGEAVVGGHRLDSRIRIRKGLHALGDDWLADQLTAARDGDSSAERRILLACIRLKDELFWHRLAVSSFVEKFQLGLKNAIHSYRGSSTTGFLAFAKQEILRQLGHGPSDEE